jgi:hypothetical protein
MKTPKGMPQKIDKKRKGHPAYPERRNQAIRLVELISNHSALLFHSTPALT